MNVPVVRVEQVGTVSTLQEVTSVNAKPVFTKKIATCMSIETMTPESYGKKCADL